MKIRIALIVLFLGVIGFALFQIWDTENNYIKEQSVREQMEQFKPTPPDSHAVKTDDDGSDDGDKPLFVNQNIVDARSINPDIAGWVSLDGTNIDYPFVQAADNDYYLRRDIYGKYAYAGTVFMEYRNTSDFSNFVTVLYGHNMKNGSMFADIRRYENTEFFNTNDTGWLYLENATYKLEIFAYMTVRGDDDSVYAVRSMDELDRQKYLLSLQERAQRYRELLLSVNDNIIVLSTCTSTSKEMRRVVIARLVRDEEQYEKAV